MINRSIRYVISSLDPPGHYFDVEMSIDEPNPAGQELTLPAWIPGSYMIRDFARNVIGVRAYLDGKAVAIIKADKQTWRTDAGSGALTIRYRVYAWDLSVRSAHLDQTHAYFNGSSVFLMAVGRENENCRVEIKPLHGTDETWRVATTLPPDEVDDRGFGSYTATNYERLIDCPVEIGRFEVVEFEVAGVIHRMAVSGQADFDAQRLAQDLRQICTQQLRLFDSPLPISQYLFLTTVVADGYGGLEHCDSSSLMCGREDLPIRGMVEPSDGYRRFLGLCSHEYFHLWNVKRIKPKRFKRADLSREVHTNLLWAFEGITSYYDDLALVRSGCINSNSYLQLLSQTITRVMRSHGRMVQSIAESSFDAWTKFYKQDENAINSVVSYYGKGALVALGLDVTLRTESEDLCSLDSLMRALWERNGKTDIGVAEDGIEHLASELVDKDLSDYFRRYVHGVEEMPLERWLAELGIGFRLRQAAGPEDLGGAGDSIMTPLSPILGATYKTQGPLIQLTGVTNGGAAHMAGLSAGDRIVALAGLQVEPRMLAKRISLVPVGDAVSIHAFRNDQLMEFDLMPQAAPQDTCDLWLLEQPAATSEQLRRRQIWLGGH